MPQVGFITLPEAWSTGSSIMPQKRNPDAAELVRGQAGKITGALVHLLMLMKGLPLAYNKDMQDDKPPLFLAVDTLSLCLPACAGMIASIKFNTEKMEAAAVSGYATATDLADYLVQNHNLPFREAHHHTGAIVRLAETAKKPLHELPLEAMQQIFPSITAAVYAVLTPRAAMHRRTSFGGTAPVRVREALKAAQQLIGD
jgi:argininosuccinate lyase